MSRSTKKKSHFTARNVKREKEKVSRYLKSLVDTFIHFVKKQEDKEGDAVALKFTELNKAWKNKVKDKRYSFLTLNLLAFEKSITAHVKEINGVHESLKLTKEEEGSDINKVLTLDNLTQENVQSVSPQSQSEG